MRSDWYGIVAAIAMMPALVLASGCSAGQISTQTQEAIDGLTASMELYRDSLGAVRPILVAHIDEDVCRELEAEGSSKEESNGVREIEVPDGREHAVRGRPILPVGEGGIQGGGSDDPAERPDDGEPDSEVLGGDGEVCPMVSPPPDPRIAECEQSRRVQEALLNMEHVLAVGQEYIDSLREGLEDMAKFTWIDWLRFALRAVAGAISLIKGFGASIPDEVVSVTDFLGNLSR